MSAAESSSKPQPARPHEPAPAAERPYGAQQPRSRLPVYVLGVLYGVWLVVLIWLAVFTTGR